MKNLRWIVWMAVVAVAHGFVASGGWAEDQPPAEPPAEQSPLRQAQYDPQQTYYLHVPRACAGARPCPVVVVLHGALASGQGDFNLWKPYAVDEGFVLIAPNFSIDENFPGRPGQFPKKEDQIVFRLVNELSKEIRLDRQKIMLIGFSNGAKFVYAFVMTHRGFAHSAVLFNTGNLEPPEPATVPGRPRLYLAVGGEEKEYAQQAPGFVEALKQAGYSAQLLIATGVGHSIPSRSIGDVVRMIRSMKAGG